MFIKTILQGSKEVKTIRNYVSKCSLYLPLLIKQTFVPCFTKIVLLLILRKKPNFSFFSFLNNPLLSLNHSSLPVDDNYITEKRLSTVTFSAKYIEKIIQNFLLNKAHGHDNISVRILKIYGGLYLCTITDDF